MRTKIFIFFGTFSIIFFVISVSLFAKSQVTLDAAVKIKESATQSVSFSKPESSKSSDSSISSSWSSSQSSISQNFSKSSLANSISSSSGHEITLVGAKCNGSDWYSQESAGYCKVLDNGQEVGKIYFNYQNSSLSPMSTGNFQPMANGYYYMGKVGKTQNEQYIRYVPGSEWHVYGGVIYKYSFATQKISRVEEFYYKGLNYPGQSPNLQSFDKPECKSRDNLSFWDYSCFFAVDDYMEQNPTTRLELNSQDKARIDKDKTDYLYYKKMAAIYGLKAMDIPWL